MPGVPFRYLTGDEDSGRWAGFPFRDGDIVISARSRSGTTWTQLICALLIFQAPGLPAPLGQLSPWLDHLTARREQVYALLAAQQHRRFIKTHTPLDGIPLDPRATYIVTARDPLDTAVSFYYHRMNIDRARMQELTGEPGPAEPAVWKPLRDWLLAWIGRDADPRANLDSLPGVMWHLSDAWARRGDPNVVLVHYGELAGDLAGQMRRLARRLGIAVPGPVWPGLVEAAAFERMRASAGQFVPAGGILKSSTAFFRRGRPGAAREILTGEEIAGYRARIAWMAAPDLLAWLHAPGSTAPGGTGPGGLTRPG
ncbi:MAG TPA: sulfotransferase domain-containing protein [Streptosporangiaceae bacterium]